MKEKTDGQFAEMSISGLRVDRKYKRKNFELLYLNDDEERCYQKVVQLWVTHVFSRTMHKIYQSQFRKDKTNNDKYAQIICSWKFRKIFNTYGPILIGRDSLR